LRKPDLTSTRFTPPGSWTKRNCMHSPMREASTRSPLPSR
jgi:hypothetical protein